MSLERVKEYFRQFGMENRIREFSASTETVGLAALAIGCEPGRIAKTMAFFVGDRPILIAAAGDAKISNAKFREQFHAKAKMIPFELVEQAVGQQGRRRMPVCRQRGNRRVSRSLSAAV